jgi:hypothetical protein
MKEEWCTAHDARKNLFEKAVGTAADSTFSCAGVTETRS